MERALYDDAEVGQCLVERETGVEHKCASQQEAGRPEGPKQRKPGP